ncbi:effector-associated domain EAD1-containing protein [cf. Phormidesmis sp. LEGE 11477]|uniref:effector-associated domain EAD1-containing protein n=1 Tax=cf. Phormidesmis sp. LEGE 11477 TaxID=1828680 RepID=UPI0018820096|nr:effector-associated domain EAD1-containing protein [cf. Phormidesmis sp. LEGE 11477]MBE9062380.1 caspase family protein [cf. Phormidesmis sp. LEGE 11477]
MQIVTTQKRWAVLVGINDYADKAFPQLRYCVNDVVSLEGLLRQVGYTVVCLHDELPMRDARFPRYGYIEAELKKLKDKFSKGDLLLVYFACHGTRQGDGTPRLVVEDTRAETLADTGIAVSAIERWMRESGAGQLVLVLDACRMGQGTDERNIEVVSEFIQDVYKRRPEGFALLASSTAEQVSREFGELQHGLFSYYVLSGLAGAAKVADSGQVTVGSLKHYVMGELTRESVVSGISQMPQGRQRGDLDLDNVVLVDEADLAFVKRPVAQKSGPNVQSGRNAQEQGVGAMQVPEQLSGDDYDQLVEALLSAFPNSELLAFMVKRALRQPLNVISQGATSYEVTVDRVVEWSKAQGKLQDLMEGALKKNPGNPKLRTLAQRWGQ